MGGINHQPCNKYLGLSTAMSRFFSLARAKLEMANVHLEDALLSEINTSKGSPANLLTSASMVAEGALYLDKAIDTSNQLEQMMSDLGYKPWPAFALFASPEKMIGLGEQLGRHGLVDLNSFKEIALPQLEGGFLRALELLRGEMISLRELHHGLASKLDLGVDLAKVGRLTSELESNGELSFRGSFMAVYARWNKVHNLFLASAALSTELWFRSSGSGSLMSEGNSSLQKTA